MAWFFAPYKRRNTDEGPELYCAMDDFTAQIRADMQNAGAIGPPWSESECLGSYAVVKVSTAATVATLQAIAATAGFDRIPLARLNDATNTLTGAQRNAVTNRLTTLGYTNAEINARFPLGFGGPYILADILRFALTRRLLARWDIPTDTIVFDGPQQPTGTPEQIDGMVL